MKKQEYKAEFLIPESGSLPEMILERRFIVKGGDQRAKTVMKVIGRGIASEHAPSSLLPKGKRKKRFPVFRVMLLGLWRIEGVGHFKLL